MRSHLNVIGTSAKAGCGHLRRQFLREYVAWSTMRQRCTNPKHSAYPYYGGRGIAVCERWHTFEAFIADMGPKPHPSYTLDRIDNDGGYSPENCRWSDWATQMRNRRHVKLYAIDGEQLSLADIARRLSMPYQTLDSRLRAGWTLAELITLPCLSKRRLHAASRRVRRRARTAVNNAIRSGRLLKPVCCTFPGCELRPQAHHAKGYAKRHWLDVEWLCAKHHARKE